LLKREKDLEYWWIEPGPRSFLKKVLKLTAGMKIEHPMKALISGCPKKDKNGMNLRKNTTRN